MRLDAALVARGLARSRADAADLIRSGTVLIDGVHARKAAVPVADGDSITVSGARLARVGRAAYKLEEAFAVFGAADDEPLTVHGRGCLDVGASTGGFTEVLLDRGAAHVTALDVGHDQLVAGLRADPRVTEVSGRNIRDVTAAELSGPFEILVADLSFISLCLVMPSLAALVATPGQAVLLVKPQFEVGRSGLGKNGIVRDDQDRVKALTDVAHAVRRAGLFPRSIAPTNLPGGTGNHEYLVWVTTRPELALTGDAAAAADAVRSFERER